MSVTLGCFHAPLCVPSSSRLYLINSPVVRGDNLRFKEEGVRDVLKDVLLPWYNAYRFFIQNVLRLQKVRPLLGGTGDGLSPLLGRGARAWSQTIWEPPARRRAALDVPSLCGAVECGMGEPVQAAAVSAKSEDHVGCCRGTQDAPLGCVWAETVSKRTSHWLLGCKVMVVTYFQ